MEVVERLHRLARIGDRLDLVSGLLEDGADEMRDVAIVVHNEDPPAQGIASAGGRGFLVEHL